MGYSIAEAFADAGAEVILVSGPTALKPNNKDVKIVHVTSAASMYAECNELIQDIDIVVFAAAVADFTPEVREKNKIKRDREELVIRLKPTLDIAGELGKKKRPDQLFIGFALETNEGLTNATEKLKRKNLDFIVLNSLQDAGAGFGTETNKITIIDKSGNIDKFELKLKSDVALDIVKKTIKLIEDA